MDMIEDELDRGRLVRMRNCPEPPPRLVLAQMLQDQADETGVPLGMDVAAGKIGDVPWMLMCLATLNSNHAIFAKNYRYVRPAVQQRQDIMFNNNDGFFDDLPDLVRKKDLKGRLAANIGSQDKMRA